jgi:CheY-like chemotaxis protein
LKIIVFVKGLFAVIALFLAAIRLFFASGDLNQRMDYVLLVLVGAAFLVIVVPWDKINSLKAAGVEFTLDKPQVKAALASLGRVADKKLRDRLAGLTPDIEEIKGARILWIDDHPHENLGERRLLRALGLEIVSVKCRDEATEIIEREDDFDLLISNLGSHDVVPRPGIGNVKAVRDKDENLRHIPAIFYTSSNYEEPKRMETLMNQIQSNLNFPLPELVDTLEMLVETMARILPSARRQPIKIPSRKVR